MPTDGLRVQFAEATTVLTEDAKGRLRTLLDRVQGDDTLRLQLLAYAGGDDLTASKARRVSLSRALAVRSYLMENGVKSSRIDVRALGDKAVDGPANRVDVNIVKR